jgi:hypothetical protein
MVNNGNKRLEPKIFARILQISVPIIFVIFILFFFPFRNRFEFNNDEGIQLMKSMMVIEGYPLYDQVWSDQPPLMTYILVFVFKIFGLDVNVGRFTILILSACLIWASFKFLRIVWGSSHAIAGVILIVLLPWYMTLSVSVMVGLPSLTFSMFSILSVAIWHIRRSSIFVVLSALAMSISIQIKLFSGFLIPIIIIGLLLDEIHRQRRNINFRALLRPVILWILIFTIITLVITYFFVGLKNLDQLYMAHFRAVYAIRGEIFTINYHLRDSMTMLFLSMFGIIFTILAKRWLTLYLVAWLGTTYLLLNFYSPVWYHQQLLVTLPAAMLAGISVGECIHWISVNIDKRNFLNIRSILPILGLGALMLVLYDQIPDIFYKLEIGANQTTSNLRVSEIKEDIYERAKKYSGDTHWIVTNMPMTPFRLNIPVPPNLVVFSIKRLKTDLISEKEILQTIQDYSPEQVFISFKIDGINSYLEENYHLIYNARNLNFYIRNDIYKKHAID